jgi:N-acylneuraminate cytidylyltransferase/CMP-N,N'-diacetyllegionaminic acid synthase
MILGLVCARAGSKGIPGKNLLELGGTTLLDIAIRKALDAKHVDAVCVNTDIDVSELQRAYQDSLDKPVVYARRRKELAGSSASKWPVFKDSLHAFEKWAGAQVAGVVDIDVSRPLTTPDDVDSTLEAWLRSECPVTLAVGHADKSPYFDIYEHDISGALVRAKRPPYAFTARQDGPPCWYHGGIMAVARGALLESDDMWDLVIESHEIAAHRCHDIDEWADWVKVRALYEDATTTEFTTPRGH